MVIVSKSFFVDVEILEYFSRIARACRRTCQMGFETEEREEGSSDVKKTESQNIYHRIAVRSESCVALDTRIN